MFEQLIDSAAVIEVQPIDNSTGQPVTGSVSASLGSVYIQIGTNSTVIATSPSLTHKNNGLHSLSISLGDIASLGHCVIRVEIADCLPITIERMIVSRLTNGAAIAIEEDTDELQQDWEDDGRLDQLLDSKMATDHIAATAGKVNGVATVDTCTENSDMRGTNLALLAENYTAPNNSQTATLESRLTPARAGYLDNLNVSGQVASQADVQGITQAQRVRLTLPTLLERPDAGSTDYRLYIYAYDAQHVAEDLDSNPMVSAENAAGTDRSSNLGTVTKASGTGIYYVDYTLSSSNNLEQLFFRVTAAEGSVETEYSTSTLVVDTTAVDFTTADRAKLEFIHGKMPGRDYLAGTTESTGAIPAADKTGFALSAAGVTAVQSGLGTSANQTAISNAIAALQDLSSSDVQTVLTGLGYTSSLATNIATTNGRIDVQLSTVPGLVWNVLTSAITTANTIGKLIIDRMATILKLDATLESDGLSYRFNANALEQAPTGSGGSSGPIMVTVANAIFEPRLVGPVISVHYKSPVVYQITTISSVDISAFEHLDFELVVEADKNSDTDLLVVGSDAITFTPDDSDTTRGVFEITFTAADLAFAKHGSFLYSLRRTDDEATILSHDFRMIYSPYKDS